MKPNYHVIAYRWGYLNEPEFLFSSESLDDCYTVAKHYPDYRGGKYGCAVYQSPSLEDGMNGDCATEPVHYFPSLHGEDKPKYNHRCDVFNGTVCRIKHDKRFEFAPCWIQDIIEEDEKTADRRNERE